MCSDWKKQFFKVYFNENSTQKEIDKVLKIKNNNIPKYLFKYTGIDHIDDLLENNLFYLSNINELNDPYEGNIIYNRDLQIERFYNNLIVQMSNRPKINYNSLKINIKKEIDILKELIIKNKIPLNTTMKKSDMSQIMENINKTTQNLPDILKNMQEKNVKDFFETLTELITTNTKLICLSESNKNNPLWDRYGHEHEGICIKYDTDKFSKEIKENCFPIFYDNSNFTDNMPLKDIEKLKANYNLKALIKKSFDWRCENEWRIIATDNFRNNCNEIYRNDEIEYLKLNPTTIYLGKDFPNDKIDIIKKICKNNGIDLYKMKQENTQYELIEESI